MDTHTELVMDRYRELKSTGLSGLEASRVVLREAQEWTLGKSVPTQGVPTADVPTCQECGINPREGRYKLCAACRKSAYRERSK